MQTFKTELNFMSEKDQSQYVDCRQKDDQSPYIKARKITTF